MRLQVERTAVLRCAPRRGSGWMGGMEDGWGVRWMGGRAGGLMGQANDMDDIWKMRYGMVCTGWKDGWAPGRVDGRWGGWINGARGGWMQCRIDGAGMGWMDEVQDGWCGGRMDGVRDEWMR